jgi:hypothetical protein
MSVMFIFFKSEFFPLHPLFTHFQYIHTVVFQVIMPRTLTGGYQNFGEKYHRHFLHSLPSVFPGTPNGKNSVLIL